jgi:hypothetical protein
MTRRKAVDKGNVELPFQLMKQNITKYAKRTGFEQEYYKT